MYIVTGGAGFIGSAMIWKLNQMGIDDIIVVDNLASSEKWYNLVNRRFTDYLHRDTFRKMLEDNRLHYKIDGIISAESGVTRVERDHVERSKGPIHDYMAAVYAAYGTGATKFALDPDTKFYQLMLDVKHVAATLGDISEYDSISFYVYRDSTAKFLVRGRSLSDYNSSTTVSSLAGQTWQKVTIPLAKFTDWDDIRIWLVDNSWNPVNGTTWYVSNILAEPAAAEPEA